MPSQADSRLLGSNFCLCPTIRAVAGFTSTLSGTLPGHATGGAGKGLGTSRHVCSTTGPGFSGLGKREGPATLTLNHTDGRRMNAVSFTTSAVVVFVTFTSRIAGEHEPAERALRLPPR